jgi:DNA-binding transcriptional LysR family regulator
MYRTEMEFRQLRYLAAVAHEGSFTVAAQKLLVAQPAISQQIRKLEAELGVELLHRGGAVRPTPAGVQVLKRAEFILAQATALREEVQHTADLLTGRVTLGSMQWLGPFDLPRLIGHFRRTYPGVEIALAESTTPQMIMALCRDELDLTFTSLTGDFAHEGVEICVLAEEEMVVVGSEDLMQAGTTEVCYESLDGQPFVAFAPGMNLRRLVDQMITGAGVQPHVVLESNEPLTVRALAAHGAGLAIVPRLLAESGGEPVAIRSLRPVSSRQLGLAWRKHRRLPPGASRLRDLALSGEFLMS